MDFKALEAVKDEILVLKVCPEEKCGRNPNLQIHPAVFPQNNSGKLGVKLFYFVTLLLHEAYIINQDLLK